MDPLCWWYWLWQSFLVNQFLNKVKKAPLSKIKEAPLSKVKETLLVLVVKVKRQLQMNKSTYIYQLKNEIQTLKKASIICMSMNVTR